LRGRGAARAGAGCFDHRHQRCRVDFTTLA
jgi:hypothetical protein